MTAMNAIIKEFDNLLNPNKILKHIDIITRSQISDVLIYTDTEIMIYNLY